MFKTEMSNKPKGQKRTQNFFFSFTNCKSR